MTAQRNVLFLIADDWSRIAGCYGNSVVHTPRIDSFARQSATFDQAFCTSPSCAVSRACILTGYHSHTHGQYGHCHGIHGFSTHPHITSTPSSLKEHGYATACIGKKHVEPPSVYPFDFEPQVDARNGVELARAARDFWAANPDQPFYMHVGFFDPHRAGRGFGNERPYPDVPATPYRPDDVVVPPYLPDVPDVRADLAEYSTDLFRSATWTAVRRDAIPAMGERPIRHLLVRAPEELYDLEADPTESVNRIDDPHLREVAAQMRTQLYQFRRDTADPWLEVDFQEGRIDRLEPR